jgi:hypothetical protein
MTHQIDRKVISRSKDVQTKISLRTTKPPMSSIYSLEASLYLSFSRKRETRLERATFTLAR